MYASTIGGHWAHNSRTFEGRNCVNKIHIGLPLNHCITDAILYPSLWEVISSELTWNILPPLYTHHKLMISWRPCFVQQLDFGFSQKGIRHGQSGENRTEVYQRISSKMSGACNGRYIIYITYLRKCPALAMGNTADTCVMKGSMFTQVRAFFYKQCFHNEIHTFLPERLQFSWSVFETRICFWNRYTVLVIDTLNSACGATVRFTAILDRHVKFEENYHTGSKHDGKCKSKLES